MIYKYLGKTQVKIPAIGLGTSIWFGFKNKQKDNHLIQLIQTSIDLGISFADTAEIYFEGHAEKLISKAIVGKRNKVLFAPKFSTEHCLYRKIIKAIEGSLKRLQTDYIDLYQIHWPNPKASIKITMKALEKLVKDGKYVLLGSVTFLLKNFYSWENKFKGQF